MNLNNNLEEFCGKVLWYKKEKGYGAILENNSQEAIFAHHSNIDGNNKSRYVILKENEPVKFNIVRTPQKVSAINICPINGHFQDERPYKNNKIEKEKSKYHIRNTTDFTPNHDPVDMRIMVDSAGDKYKYEVSSKDIIIVKNIFDSSLNIYQKLESEINNSGVEINNLWKSWHGDTHFIADDHLNWKHKCPTFNMILDKISNFFDMKIKATRLNFYSDSLEWKPFHHDAAAVKQDKAASQNFTVAVSFGLTREVAFQHAKNGTIISFPAEDGSVYVFSKDVNIIWKHGIRQYNPDNYKDEGRFSIIAWGWRNMID